eukprot:TRINITY_DN14442_c0_g1_i4.p1 TRINITY_DN14442_c0_g1~~TRINITY_DN14442_c0_g1_i4.p1  ORF type:complete len:152 (+),score=34.84 TRINITY_DN14442_c0_g1_i4:135-590(+)
MQGFADSHAFDGITSSYEPDGDEGFDDDFGEEADIPFAMTANSEFGNTYRNAAARGGLEAWIKDQDQINGRHDTMDDRDRRQGNEANVALVLFALGWCCYFPWFFGAKYIKSRSLTARVAGIASLVFAILVFFVVSSMLISARLRHIGVWR